MVSNPEILPEGGQNLSEKPVEAKAPAEGAAAPAEKMDNLLAALETERDTSPDPIAPVAASAAAAVQKELTVAPEKMSPNFKDLAGDVDALPLPEVEGPVDTQPTVEEAFIPQENAEVVPEREIMQLSPQLFSIPVTDDSAPVELTFRDASGQEIGTYSLHKGEDPFALENVAIFVGDYPQADGTNGVLVELSSDFVGSVKVTNAGTSREFASLKTETADGSEKQTALAAQTPEIPATGTPSEALHIAATPKEDLADVPGLMPASTTKPIAVPEENAEKKAA